MAKFSQLFPWLRDLYPPAEARGFQPSEVSEDVSLVHEVYRGTDFVTPPQSIAVSGGAGATFIDQPTVDEGFYHYVIACSAFHNDTVTDRDISIQLRTPVPVNIGIASSPRPTPANVFVVVPRSFILPTFQALRASVPAIGGAFTVTLRTFFFRIRLGSPAVPSP